ncbi:hypothetical protein WA158_007266 [Blastocystis sp. Blastoise]
MPENEFDGLAIEFKKKRKWREDSIKSYLKIIKDRNLIKSTDEVMDFGCGVGTLAFICHEMIGNNSIYEVDSSEEMIKINKQLIEEAGLTKEIQAECVSIDRENLLDLLGGRKFDVIISVLTFHHIKEPPQILSILKTYLKPHGRIIVIDIEYTENSPFFRYALIPRESDGFTINQMETFYKEAGMIPEVFVEEVLCSRFNAPQEIRDLNKTLAPKDRVFEDKYWQHEPFNFIFGVGRNE